MQRTKGGQSAVLLSFGEFSVVIIVALTREGKKLVPTEASHTNR